MAGGPRRCSATELEILYGVLNNPGMRNRACFYFRDPAYVDRVPAARRADHVDDDPTARAKLANLKRRIRESGSAVREAYPTPKALGELVLRDLTTAINQDYPPDAVPDPLDRARAEHDAFARRRTGVYVGRPAYSDRLDAHAAAEDGPPLVVLGESGSGKSALLANSADRYGRVNPDAAVICHFVGAMHPTAGWAHMLRRLCGELRRCCGDDDDDDVDPIPDGPAQLRPAFADWLRRAGRRASEGDGASSW